MKKRTLLGLFLLIILTSFVFSACGGGRSGVSYKHRRGGWSASTGKTKLPDVKLVVNDRVMAWVKYFTGPGRDRFETYLERSGRYMPLMQSILKEHGLPEDTVYISLIESGFSGKAHSIASAVGFWQFIGSTGRHYNLGIDPYVDERRDFEKSTHAAAKYLTYLYSEFGDWYLAFAGYNAGEGKIGRAIKMYGTKDFWALSDKRHKYLKPETKDYVPKYIAAAIIAKNPKKFGFKVNYHERLEFEETKLTSQADYEIIAKCAKTDVETIEMLNPEMVMGISPPNVSQYLIRVPKGSSKVFHKSFARVPKHMRVTRDIYVQQDQYHKVRRGETLSKIARRYGVSIKSLLSANGLKRSKSLHAGKRLVIPGKTSKVKVAANTARSDKFAMSSAAASSANGTKSLINYKIKRGDAIGGIAAKFGVTIEDIRSWNKIKGNKIVAGRKLKIYQTVSESVAAAPADGGIAPLAYKVKSGDTLISIAKKYKLKVDDVKKWNRLDNNNIRAGQKLRLGPNVKVERSPVAEVIAAESGSVESQSAVTPVAQASAPSNARTSSVPTYKVRSGDTLYGIAIRNEMTVAELAEMNNISRNALIRPGMKLKVKSDKAPLKKSASSDMMDMAADAPAVPAAEIVKYKVQSGDTAWGIAKKHNLSINDIQRLNSDKNLKKIKPGDVIKLRAQREAS